MLRAAARSSGLDEFLERDRLLKGNAHPVPNTGFAAACLIKLDQQLVSMGVLRQYLVEHPTLVWLLGFPLVVSRPFPWGFDAEASLPTQRYFTRLLRRLPKAPLQLLLDETVRFLRAELCSLVSDFGQAVWLRKLET